MRAASKSISVELVRPVGTGRHGNLNQKLVCESAPEGGGESRHALRWESRKDGEDCDRETNQRPCMLQMSEGLACRRRTKALRAGLFRKCWSMCPESLGRSIVSGLGRSIAWATNVSGTIAGAMSPEGTSTRRWCSSESRTLTWYSSTGIHTTTCQATASKYSDGISSKYSDGISSKYSNGISSTQAEALAKVSRMRA